MIRILGLAAFVVATGIWLILAAGTGFFAVAGLAFMVGIFATVVSIGAEMRRVLQ